MQAVRTESRHIGDSIKIYDVISGWNTPTFKYDGKVVRMTKTQLVITSDSFQGEKKFNRATGFQVGFNYPTATLVVAPETSK